MTIREEIRAADEIRRQIYIEAAAGADVRRLLAMMDDVERRIDRVKMALDKREVTL